MVLETRAGGASLYRPSASFRPCAPGCVMPAWRHRFTPSFSAPPLSSSSRLRHGRSSPDRAQRTPGRSGNLRTSPDLCRYRCGGRYNYSAALLRHISRDRLVFIATMVYALTIAALATIRSEAALYGVMIVSGAAWVSVLSSLQVAAQISVPAWVRGRATIPLHHGLLRRDDARQPAVGLGCGACGNSRRPADFGRGRGAGSTGCARDSALVPGSA